MPARPAVAAVAAVIVGSLLLPTAGWAVEPPPPDPEAALRRVLRSGCRDGLAEVQAQLANPAAPWAATVARLCGEILREPPPPLAAAPAGAPSPGVHEEQRNGRGLLVVGFTLYGIWLGIATDVLFEIGDLRGAIVAPMLGMAAGLSISLLASSDHPVTNSQSWTIITGLEYGSLNGALWAGGLDLSAKGVVGTALATGLAGGTAGILIARAKQPREGDIEVVRSGLLWGTVSGFLAMGAFAPDAGTEIIWRTAGAAMDVGFVAGLALAGSFDVSRNRMLIIDAATLGGGLTGMGLALLIGGTSGNARALFGAGLAGMYAGMVTTALLTRGMDHKSDLADATVPALYARDAGGRWRWSTPGAMPLLDLSGGRIVGATVTALGGTF
jgi:hypothetical protein